MRFLITLLILGTSTLTVQPKAQVTAVMEARVAIISGAAISAIKQAIVELPTEIISDDLNIGSFLLTTAPSTEVVISVKKKFSSSENEVFNYKSFSVEKKNLKAGVLEVSLFGELDIIHPLARRKQDKAIVMVEYL